MSGLQVAARAVIFGRVQGVGFRYACFREAQHMREARHARAGANLTGWVRNTGSGGVEVFAQGDPQAVNALLAWCRKGPARAVVERVEESPADYDPALLDFEIR
ncbi:MAG: acylphosphatase [Deltaproteobacteria bacterium]|nr:acylphosphatase [Deltaproteobacteria bacterium]